MLLQDVSSMPLMTHCIGSRSTGQSSKKLVSAPTTQPHSRYPVNMPWHITGFTLKTLVLQQAYVHQLLSQNTSWPSSNPGADQTYVRLSSRSSSQTRGTINFQVLTRTSNNMGCCKVPLSQMPSKGCFHPRVITSHHPIRRPLPQYLNYLKAPKMMRKTFGDLMMRAFQVRSSLGRRAVRNIVTLRFTDTKNRSSFPLSTNNWCSR